MINEKYNVYNYGEYIEKLEIENARLEAVKDGAQLNNLQLQEMIAGLQAENNQLHEALEHLYEESSKFNVILQQTELMNEAYSALHPEVNE